MARCVETLEAHGRRWRCTRPAARKHAEKLCGRCAATHPPACREDAFGRRRHSAACFTGQAECALLARLGGGE